MYNSKELTSRTFHAKGVARVPLKADSITFSHTKKPLQEDRRKALETLLKNESNREKRSKLQAVLTTKLALKYGRHNTKSISVVVSKFLQSHDDITSDDLKSLETDTEVEIARVSSNKTQADVLKQSVTPKIVEPASETPALPDATGKEWQVLQAYQAIVADDRAKKADEQKRQRVIAYRQTLDDHMTILKQNKQNRNVDDVEYVKHVEQDINKYHQEEEMKVVNLKKKHLDEKHIREAQIEELKQIRQAERDEMKRQEEANIRLDMNNVEKDKQKVLQAKDKERKRQEVIAKENQENLGKRAENKKIEAAEDYRLMQEYAAKLDREAYERDTAFQRRITNLEKYASAYHNDGAGKKERDEELKFETSLIREIKRKEEEDLKEEKRRQDNNKTKELRAAQENSKLLQRKKQEKEENLQNEKMIAEQYRRDALLFQQQIDLEKKNRALKQREYRSVLDSHLQIRQFEDVNLEGMAEKEKKINLPELKRIMSDKQMYTRVLNKMGVAGKK